MIGLEERNEIDIQVKSKKRVADHGEVFTAEREVTAMIDLVKQEAERIDARFLEPACGNGNFLAEVLKRKLAVVKKRYGKSQLEYEQYTVLAVSSIYGVDIFPALVGVFHQQDPCARGLDGTAGHATNRDDEVLPKPYIDCMAVRHFGLLVKNTNKGGKDP